MKVVSEVPEDLMDSKINRFSGLIIILISCFLLISIFSFNVKDISDLYYPANEVSQNFFGKSGALVAYAMLMYSGGFAAITVSFLFLTAGLLLLFKGNLEYLLYRSLGLVLFIVSVAGFDALFSITSPAVGIKSGGLTGYYLLKAVSYLKIGTGGGGLIFMLLSVTGFILLSNLLRSGLISSAVKSLSVEMVPDSEKNRAVFGS